MTTRHITYLSLSALKPAEHNAKDHDLPSIMSAIQRHGFNSPAEIDERTERLVAGHGRREACIMLRQMGEPPPEGVFVDDDGDWLIPVLRGYRSENDTDAKAYIIGSNQTSIAGGWHLRELAVDLEDVVTTDATLMEGMGFTSESLDELLRRIDPETIGEQDPDKPRPLPVADLELEDPDDGPTIPEPDLSVATKTRVETCPECGHEFERTAR